MSQESTTPDGAWLVARLLAGVPVGDIDVASDRLWQLGVRAIEERSDATRLRASAPSSRLGPIDVDVSVAKPPGHESLNVVIPWSDRRFQFTSKQNTRPASGSNGMAMRVCSRTKKTWPSA